MVVRQLYDTWLDKAAAVPELSVCVQMQGWVAHFEDFEAAERYVKSVKVHREREGLKK